MNILNDVFYAAIWTCLYSLGLYVLSLILYYIFKKSGIDLFQKIFKESIKSFYITTVIIGFIVMGFASYITGIESYDSWFRKGNFNTQFIVNIVDENDNSYYEKAECNYESNFLSDGYLIINKIEFNNGGYLNPNFCDTLSYKDFATFTDQRGKWWKVKLINEIKSN